MKGKIEKNRLFRCLMIVAVMGLFGLAAILTPTLAQTPGSCTPTTTVTEGDLFPGGLASFGVSSGPGSVTVDSVNAGTGLQSFTVVGTPSNAVVTIPPFTPGTFDPVTATFTVIDPSQPVDFTLRAANTFHAIFIRVRCAGSCTPTTTVTEGDLFPGGLASFGVSSGPGSVTVDHVNAGSGLQSFTVVGVPTNAIVTIPPFTPGTFDPVTATFTVIDPSQPVDFTLRAASTFHAIFIRVRCGTAPPPTACPTFTSTVPITIPAGAPTGLASPYPSNINVAGLTGTVTKVTVTLNGLSHTFPDDLDILLVGPGGQSVILMSDTGSSLDVVNVNLTFDDAAANSLPDADQIISGFFKPTNFGTDDTFPAPAPAGPYGATLSVFNGTAPNGIYSLYVVDDLGGDVGSLGGFTLRISTTTTNCIFPAEIL